MECRIGSSYARCEEGGMRKLTWCAAASILCAGAMALTHQDVARAQSAPQSGAVTVIRAGTLIDGVSETPRKNQLILPRRLAQDRKSTRLNSSHEWISYAVFCLKKKN